MAIKKIKIGNTTHDIQDKNNPFTGLTHVGEPYLALHGGADGDLVGIMRDNTSGFIERVYVVGYGGFDGWNYDDAIPLLDVNNKHELFPTPSNSEIDALFQDPEYGSSSEES